MAIKIPINKKVMTVLASPFPFIALWWLGGLLTIFVPRAKWNDAQQGFYNTYGRMNEYNQNQYQQNDYNEGYRAFNCKWYQSDCRQQQFNFLMSQGDGNSFYNPSWYQFLGGNIAQDDRDMEIMGMTGDENSGALKFVYAWMVIMFLGVLAYRTFVLYKRHSVWSLNIVLAIAAQYALLMMLVIPQGVIRDFDEREMEQSIHGWYGQLGVLLVYFSYAQLLFAGIFMVLVTGKAVLDHALFGKKEQEKSLMEEEEQATAESGDYVAAV